MLSQTGIYALRALLYLAMREDEEPVTAAAMAADLGIPSTYLAKTLQRLGREGLLQSVRGARGGYRLAVIPAELSVARIVAPFEDWQRDGVCLLGGRPCDPANPCPAHERWAAWTGGTIELLETTMLADLVGRRPPTNGSAPS